MLQPLVKIGERYHEMYGVIKKKIDMVAFVLITGRRFG